MAKSNFIVRGGADFSGITKAMAKTQGQLKSFQGGISKSMKAVATILSTLAIGTLIKDSTKMAMGVESAMDNIARNMGSSAAAFNEWAQTQSNALGMARSDAYKYGSTFSNLLGSFSTSAEQTAAETKKLMQAAAVISSKTGRTYEDTANRIRSGMLGSTEAIEDLGIYTQVSMLESTEAFKKFANGKSWAQLDFQLQQQIRLAAILEQSYKRYGDTLADTTQTRQAMFIASLKNIQLNIGQAFLPIYNFILPALTALANKIGYITSIFSQFTQAIFGKAKVSPAVDEQAESMENLGDATAAAGKKAKGTLAGFDEINTLSDSSGGGGTEVAAGAGASKTGPMPLDFTTNAPDISPKVKEMADKVKAAFADMTKFISDNKEIIISALAGIGVAFATFTIAGNWTAIMTGLKATFAGIGAVIGAISLPVLLIAAAVGALVGAFVYFYQTNEKFRGIVDGILNAIKDAAVYLWKNVLVPFGKFIGGLFVTAWEGLTTVVKWLWKNILVPFGAWIEWFKDNVLVPVGGVLKDVLGIAFQTVADIAKSFWKEVLVPLGKFFTETFEPAVEALSTVFNTLWLKVLQPFGTFMKSVLQVGFKALTDTIVYLWHKVLEPVSTFIAGGFKNTFTTVFSGIGTTINGLKTTLIGIMTFITGVFTGDWKKAWEGVKGIFKGVFDSLYGIIKVPLNLIIDAINTVTSGLSKIKFKMPDWMGGKSFGISIPSITRLKDGGITNGPMHAIVGDNLGGREVVSPLDDLKDIIAGAVSNAMKPNGNGNNSPTTVILKVGETEFARVVINSINNLQRQSGETLLAI